MSRIGKLRIFDFEILKSGFGKVSKESERKVAPSTLGFYDFQNPKFIFSHVGHFESPVTDFVKEFK